MIYGLSFIGNSSFNPLSVITQNTLKEMCENEDIKNIIEEMMSEVIFIGEKLNIKIRLTVEKKELKEQKNVGDHKTSTLQDYENKRPLELNALINSLIELGKLTNVQTPTLNTIYRIAKFFSERQGCSKK